MGILGIKIRALSGALYEIKVDLVLFCQRSYLYTVDVYSVVDDNGVGVALGTPLDKVRLCNETTEHKIADINMSIKFQMQVP